MSRAAELTEQLRARGPRPAGSDAERRAAAWIAERIGEDPRRAARLETFWARPNWAGAQAWHIAAAIGGSLLATTQARAGAVVIVVALAAMLVDWRTCRSPGRLLTREHASQNVISSGPGEQRVRLIITANLDTARLNPDHERPLPGWLFWIVAATIWTLVVALVRVEGGHSTLVGVLALIPTVALILALAWLLLATRPGDNAAGVAAALALTRILDAAPPANLAVDLVICGAASGDGLGLRRYLRSQRRRRDVTNTVVLGCNSGAGAAYLSSDGPLLALSFFGPLRRLAAETGLLSARRGHGCSAALAARLAQLPALTLAGEAEAIVAAGLALVDAVDVYVGGLVP